MRRAPPRRTGIDVGPGPFPGLGQQPRCLVLTLDPAARRFATAGQLQLILPNPIVHALASLAGMRELMALEAIGQAVRALIEWYDGVSGAHRKAWDAVQREFSAKIPRLLALPELPTDVDGLPALHRIAEQLDA
jgi:hypothetical protein